MWGAGFLLLAFALVVVALFARGGGRPSGAGRREGTAHHRASPPTGAANPRLDPDWKGNGQPVSFAFGGDVHFPAGTNLGDRLAADPSDALGPTVPELLVGGRHLHAEPRVRPHHRQLPGRAGKAVRLLRTRNRLSARSRAPGSRSSPKPTTTVRTAAGPGSRWRSPLGPRAATPSSASARMRRRPSLPTRPRSTVSASPSSRPRR